MSSIRRSSISSLVWGTMGSWRVGSDAVMASASEETEPSQGASRSREGRRLGSVRVPRPHDPTPREAHRRGPPGASRCQDTREDHAPTGFERVLEEEGQRRFLAEDVEGARGIDEGEPRVVIDEGLQDRAAEASQGAFLPDVYEMAALLHHKAPRASLG
jgi:hypothetical protein